MSQQKQPLITLSNASVRFGGKDNAPALAPTSFIIHRSDMVALIGANGAGKSTLLTLLAGHLSPTNGARTYDESIQISQHVSYLPEEPAYWENMSVAEYLKHIAANQKLKNPQEKIASLAENLLITPWLNQSMSTLSKGTRQRVHLVASILPDPEILLLDEPTDGLDPLQQEKILTFLATLAKTRAVVISTHQLHDVVPYFNRVLALKNGKLMADTTPAELTRQGGGDIAIAYRTMMGNKNITHTPKKAKGKKL